MKELEDEEEDEEKRDHTLDGVVTPHDLSAVPWHHAQLYRMYGRQADYYIHPKIQVEKQKIVHPTLKTQKGHMGANHIWTTLRHDSMSKLLKNDRRFPTELKEAFGAHVREGITKHKPPVFRNFTETEDVPDLDHLMDQSLVKHIRTVRHKKELMYRSSQTNLDRTKILLFNNPLPCVNEGDEGIDKYLPSWDDSASEVSEASYKKWLPRKGGKLLDGTANADVLERSGEEEENAPPTKPSQKSGPPFSVLSPVGSDVSEGLQSVWYSIMARQRPRKQPKYHFLTEAEARTQGTFLANLGLEKQQVDSSRNIPSKITSEARRSLPNLKSQSAQERRGGAISRIPQSRSESAHVVHDMSRFESSWQPLSMQALAEYKERIHTEGVGDFQQGRPRMWNMGVTAPGQGD